MSEKQMRLGALEAGGTKMVCAVVSGDGEVLDRMETPTREHAETVPQMIEWFAARDVDALGIGAFGPTCVDPADERYPMFASVIAVEPEHTYVGKYSAEFVEEGADVRYAVWARQLAKDDDGRVTGVYFEDEAGDMHKAVAKNGVILATGNFSSNPAMIDYYVRSAAELEPTGWPEVDAKGNVTTK